MWSRVAQSVSPICRHSVGRIEFLGTPEINLKTSQRSKGNFGANPKDLSNRRPTAANAEVFRVGPQPIGSVGEVAYTSGVVLIGKVATGGRSIATAQPIAEGHYT